MLDFLMWFPYPVRMVVIFAILFSVVPLAGLVTFGNWRQALAYSKIWFKIFAGMVIAALLISLLFQ